MRVLFVEDDSAAAQSVLLTLQAAEFEVFTTELGHQGVELAKQYQYDIIMLDLDLPDISGFEILRSLRASEIRTPILILSGFAGLDEKVKALGLGADDYMTKPFHKDELIARITAVVRRSKRPAQSVIQAGDLVINLDQRMVELAGVPLHLTVKEYEILAALAIRKGSTLTKEMLLTQLYGGLDEPGLKIIDVFLCKLRKKLRIASKGKNYIETIWGRGYVLQDPDQEAVNLPV